MISDLSNKSTNTQIVITKLKRLKIKRKKSFVKIYLTEHCCNFKLRRQELPIDAQHHFLSENQNGK